MADFNELIEAMKQAALDVIKASKPTAVMFGRVISASPLQINVEQKMTLESRQLILSRNVTDYAVEMTVDISTDSALKNMSLSHYHPYAGNTYIAGDPLHGHNYSGITDAALNEDLEHSHAIQGRQTITVHNGLMVDDEVILIQLQGGQKFLVIDRLG